MTKNDEKARREEARKEKAREEKARKEEAREEKARKEEARKEKARRDKEEARTKDKDRDRDRRRDRDADAREDDDKPLIDPVLLESFDDGEDDRYNETGRSSAGDLSFEDAQERGMTAVEYNQFKRSGASYDSWQKRRFSHKGKFHLRFAGFYAMGGIDMYYSERAVLNSTEVLERWWWQSFGMRAASGGGTFGLGFGVAAPVDISVEFSLLYGEQWLMREYRNPDGSQSTIDTHNEDNPIPRGPAMHVLIEPKGRFYFTPHKAVKPYGGIGVALFFMPPFEVPEDWAQDRPGTFVLGLEPALGVQFDTPVGIGFFIEAPFTIYLATDHGIEQGTSGSTAYLTEEEKNLPPDPASVPRFMLRAQVGVQIRM